MQISRERRWLLALAAAAVIGTVVFVASRKSAQLQVASAIEAPVKAAGFEHLCPVEAPIPIRYFDLGQTFAGLKLTSHGDICNPAAPPGATVLNGPSEAIGYVSAVYGSCTPTASAGCVPPLNVQSWPECARNPNTYKVSQPRGANSRVTIDPATLNPSEVVSLSTAPWIPALEFEGGTRLEIYSGDTTIVVFAADTRLANTAGLALANAAANQAPRSSAPRLRSAARQPGDGSTCQHRLPTHHRRSND